MEELKLYIVYHLGANACWNLRVARSPEEALAHCLDHTGTTPKKEAHEGSCRAEEVQLPGYRIKIDKIG